MLSQKYNKSESGVWTQADNLNFNYSDGDEVEEAEEPDEEDEDGVVVEVSG